MSMIYVNGALYPEEEARISVLDHGLVVGDGVFETVLLDHGRPFVLQRHLDRIARSAIGLGLPSPDLVEIRSAVNQVVASAGIETGRIRITVTAGRGPLGSARFAVAATVIVALAPETETHDDLASVVVVPWTRNERGALAGLKTTSYGENALALAFASERGGDEAIFANTLDDLCEGTGSNIFLVRRGEVVTPPLASGCLAGITRALILENHDVVEATVPMAQFIPGNFDEAFITSSIRGVMPIGSLDGVSVAATMGPVTEKIRAVYEDLVASADEL